MKLIWLYDYGMTWKNTRELCYFRNVLCMLFRKLVHLFDSAMSRMVMAIIYVFKKGIIYDVGSSRHYVNE